MPHVATGRCTCGGVRFTLGDAPMIVHCCHCTWCQRETGSAFALNAVLETARIEVTRGAPVTVVLPSASGKGQRMLRCPECQVTLWSHYAGAGEALAFVRVGTLDERAAFPPDIHIFTSTRLPWVAIPEGARAVPEYYSAAEVWPEASRKRWQRATGRA